MIVMSVGTRGVRRRDGKSTGEGGGKILTTLLWATLLRSTRLWTARAVEVPGRTLIGRAGATAWLVALCVVLPAQGVEPVRMAMPAFGSDAQIEVRDLPRAAAETAIQDALAEIHQIQWLTDPTVNGPGGLYAVQAGAGTEVPVDLRIAELLARAGQYCVWSSGVFSPLGGQVEALWQRQDTTGEGLQPQDLRDAVRNAACGGLILRGPSSPGAAPTVRIPVGGRLTAFGVRRGFAVDKAIEVLQRHGVTNAFVEIGHVVRAIGSGPDGKGWLVVVPGVPKTRHPLDQIWLRNQSLGVIRKGERRRLDHRKGVVGLGVVQVATVSELAVDTEILTHTLFVTGLPEGQRLVGVLNPKPSIFWLMGNGVGVPLESQYRWSELSRPRGSSGS